MPLTSYVVLDDNSFEFSFLYNGDNDAYFVGKLIDSVGKPASTLIGETFY